MSLTRARGMGRTRLRCVPLATMNITNLVDVTMTILICYIIITPMLKQGIEVDVPHAEAQPVDISKKHVVKINKEEHIYLDEQRVDLENLERALTEISQGEKDPLVYLEADKTLPYGKVMDLMTTIKKAKIAKVGLITTPSKRK